MGIYYYYSLVKPHQVIITIQWISEPRKYQEKCIGYKKSAEIFMKMLIYWNENFFKASIGYDSFKYALIYELVTAHYSNCFIISNALIS